MQLLKVQSFINQVGFTEKFKISERVGFCLQTPCLRLLSLAMRLNFTRKLDF